MGSLRVATVLIAAFFCVIRCDRAESDDIIQLCGSEIDTSCVKDYFSKNAWGDIKIIEEANEDPYYVEYMPIYIPKLNVTLIASDVYMSHEGSRIEEFYMNKKTGNLVMSVFFKALLGHGTGYFVINQKGKEPNVFRDDIEADYRYTVLTAVIPAADGISAKSFEDAQYSAYISDCNSPVHTGPKLMEAKDPVRQAVYKGLLSNLPIILKEIFLTKSSFYFLGFLQNTICDFSVGPVITIPDLTVVRNVLDNDIDDPAHIFEPCVENEPLTKCVQYFMEEQGTCVVAQKIPTAPIYKEKFVNFVPSLNITTVPHDAYLNLEGTVSKFYINKETSNVVISVDFPDLFVRTDSMDVIWNQRGREPRVITDSFTISSPATLTAVIPLIGGLITPESLEMALISSYLSPDLKFDIGQKFANAEDPEIRNLVKDLMADPVTSTQEYLLKAANNYFLIYLQEYICDFGLPVNQNL